VRQSVNSIEDRALRVAANVFDWSVNILDLPADGERRGGDWCDAFAISDDAVVLTIGDVSGHSESVAESMEVVRTAAFLAMHDGTDPSKALSS
jgi:serine phosphatase RsbU (regulator of sigma subunit)